MLDYDERQYALMLRSIDAFKAGRYPLHLLAANLSTILGALEKPDPAWMAACGGLCGELVGIADNEHYHQRETMSPETERQVHEIVDQLRPIVLEKVVPEDPDDFDTFS